LSSYCVACAKTLYFVYVFAQVTQQFIFTCDFNSSTNSLVGGFVPLVLTAPLAAATLNFIKFSNDIFIRKT